MHELRINLRETAYRDVGVIRRGECLGNALDTLKDLETAWTYLGVSTKRRTQNKEWVEALELRNMIQVVTTSAVAALERAESRGVHMREDYPVTDNVKWRRHIVCRCIDGNLSLSPLDVDSGQALDSEIMPYETAIIRAAEALERSRRTEIA